MYRTCVYKMQQSLLSVVSIPLSAGRKSHANTFEAGTGLEWAP